MSKFLFVDYVWDIWGISKAKEVDVSFAFERFLKDVQEGKAVEYNTGAEDIDFAAIKAEVDKLSEKEKTETIEVYKDFTSNYYDEICKFWEDENKEKFDALVAAFKETDGSLSIDIESL